MNHLKKLIFRFSGIHNFASLKHKRLIYIVLYFFLLGCNNNGNPELSISEPESLPLNSVVTEPQINEGAQFLFENFSHNFGEVIQGEQVSYTFLFKNVGKTNLVIYDVATSCGCTSSVATEAPIKPNEEGEITITFDSKHKNGEVNGKIIISANTNPAQTTLLYYANVVSP